MLAGIEKGQRRGIPNAPPLTSREHDCLLLLASGLRTDEAAAELGISRSTLNAHLAAARRKLGVSSTCQAVLRTLPRAATGADGRACEITERTAPLADGPRLSRREREALELIVRGFAVAEMAKRLNVSVRSAEKFLARARSKLAARNTAQAVYRAMVYRAIT
jgi:DNA-binding CsgD family transcriptional regulator